MDILMYSVPPVLIQSVPPVLIQSVPPVLIQSVPLNLIVLLSKCNYYVLFYIFYFCVFGLRIESPCNSILFDVWIIRSSIASARVWSPKSSCHLFTGTCEAMMVDDLPCRSSIISSKEMQVLESNWCKPKSSRIRTSCFSNRAIAFKYELSALDIFSKENSLLML